MIGSQVMNHKIWSQFLVGAQVSVFTCVQNGCADYSASYHIHWVPGALSTPVKQLRYEADHLSPTSAELKNAWKYNSTSPPSPCLNHKGPN